MRYRNLISSTAIKRLKFAAMLLPAVLFFQDATAASVSWSFTDQGFIAGGQSGTLRSYSDPGTVSASPWSFQTVDHLTVKMIFEDDSNCGAYNANEQIATAEATIVTGSATTIEVDWSGVAEQQDVGFELMTLKVDGVVVGSAQSPGGGLGCAPMAPVVSSPAPPEFFTLPSGTHTVSIQCDTRDSLYHTNAYYQFAITLNPTNCSNVAITTQPASVLADIEDTATFSVTATGSGPKTYQWRHNASNLADGTTPWGSTVSGSTTATLTIDNVQLNDIGSYSVVVANGCPSAQTSSIAQLTITNYSLVNIQFGDSSFLTHKSGPAVIGLPGDYWNIVSGLEKGSDIPSSNPVFFSSCLDSTATYTLADIEGDYNSTPDVIQNGMYIGPTLSDPMLNGFIWTAGGADFTLNLYFSGSGTYDIYLYAANPSYNWDVYFASYMGGTTYYGTCSDLTATPFEENGDYVVFKDIYTSGASIAITSSSQPFINGIQILRH